jgi:hypothetical protein
MTYICTAFIEQQKCADLHFTNTLHILVSFISKVRLLHYFHSHCLSFLLVHISSSLPLLLSYFRPLLSFFFLETGSCQVAQAGLKLAVLVPQSPECWDYGLDPPQLLYNHSWIVVDSLKTNLPFTLPFLHPNLFTVTKLTCSEQSSAWFS